MEPSVLLYGLACQKYTASPFSPKLIEDASAALCRILRNHGAKLPVEEIPERQPFKLALIEEFLRLNGDPDFAVFYSGDESFAKGVRLGVDEELPRTPAVFEEKTTWREYDPDQCEFQVDSPWRTNYPAAKKNAAALKRQFEEEAKLGAMMKIDMEAALLRYGNDLRIASLGAIQKPDDSFRVIHDGSHGAGVNNHIVVRDQLEVPCAGDLKQAMRELDGPTFVFSADVRRAHRLIKLREQDWGFQACRLSEDDGTVWLNCVGSFGVASAAIHWARAMAGLQRAARYLMGRKRQFMLTYVDDILWLAKGKDAKEAIAVILLFLVAVGLPFSWDKCKGGLSTVWVGYSIDLGLRAVGVSEKRARWLREWCGKTLRAGTVKIADMRAVLGRMSFAFTAIEHLRPFLGPMYKWVAAMCNASGVQTAKLSKVVALSLHYVQSMLEQGVRMQKVLPALPVRRELFRTDARADKEEIWIGGWSLDSEDLGQCRWFSERLNRRNAWWAFLAGEPFRAIATLEMLATLAALVVFECEAEGASCMRCSASTDNLGNACILRRWLTTSYPLSCVVMEIAALLQKRNLDLCLEWVPRVPNAEADALTNADFRGFDPALRRRFCLDEYEGVVLQRMLDAGAEMFEEVKTALVNRPSKHQKVQKSLREVDPWG